MERQGLAPQPRDEAKETALVQQCWAEELHLSRSDVSNKSLKDVRSLSKEDQDKVYKCIARKVGES